MPTNLTWRTSTMASMLHAGDLVRRGYTGLPEEIQAALVEPMTLVRTSLDEEPVPEEGFWDRAIPAAIEYPNPRQLSEVVLVKLIGKIESPIRVARFTRVFEAFRDAQRTAPLPTVAEMTQRSQSLRDAWARSGPGLLAGIARSTEEDLIVEDATVLLVPTWVTPFAQGHLLNNLARIAPVDDQFEAEVIRLAWALGQLKFDRPRYSERVPAERQEIIGKLSMIPPTLAAVEAMHLPTWPTDTAIFQLLGPTPHAEKYAKALADWWPVYQGQRPPWGIAVEALDQLVHA